MPDIVSGVNPMNTWSGKFDPNKNLYLNSNAFKTPAPFTIGNAPTVLNVRVFPSLNENLGLMKRTYIKERLNVEFRFEMFNAFNRTVLGGPATNVSDPFNFGKVTSQANGPRTAQFAMKLNY